MVTYGPAPRALVPRAQVPRAVAPVAPSQARPVAKPVSTSAGRAQPISAKPHPAVVRVIAPDANSRSLGSGTLIYVNETHGLVLTNWHVVRDAVGPVEVVFPDGFRSGGTVIKVDEDWDLAAIGIWRPEAKPVDIASRPPQPGERLTIAGYGSGSYRAAAGRCLQYLSPGDGHPFEIVELGAEARQGDSGGPIFTDQGKLAGVLLGAAHGRTVGSYCGRVDNFLANVMPVLDHQQKEMIANVESNPSAGVNRKLTAVSGDRTRASLDGGPQVPDAAAGQSASARLAADPLAANPQGIARVAVRQPAANQAIAQQRSVPPQVREMNEAHGAGDDLVAVNNSNETPWEHTPSWSSSVAADSARPMVADARSSWSSPRLKPRRPAVLATDGIEGIALDQFVGSTPIEQTKAFLAIFGIVSMLVFLLRSARGSEA